MRYTVTDFLWQRYHRGPTQAVSLVVCLKCKEMYRGILKSLILQTYIKIHVNLLQLLCIVVSVAKEKKVERPKRKRQMYKYHEP